MTSLGAHAVIVVACLFGAAPHYQHLEGQGPPDAISASIDFDLVPTAEAASEPPAPTPAPPPPVIPRRGHAVRHPHPASEVPIHLPLNSDVQPPESTDADDGDAEADEPGEIAPAVPAAVPSPPPRPAPAPSPAPDTLSITGHEATYLRTYETYPSLPRSLWVSGRVYSVLAQVCVSGDGRVSGVTIVRGAAAELDRAVASTLRSWQYRPRIIEGTPRPFCHLVKLDFTLR